MSIRDLKENEELLNSIVEDLEDYPDDTEVSYEVWALGYDSAGAITDVGLLLKTFENPDEAVDYASKLELADIVELAEDPTVEYEDKDIAFLSIEVETVVEDAEGESMNVGTIYKKDISIYDEGPDTNDELIHVKDGKYSIDEDGNLIISTVQFNHLNKNDIIKVMYDDEDFKPVLTYVIKSKTTDNKFICEFMY